MALKYSRQRQAVWDFIRERKDHPTASVVYEGVRQVFPNISLGTVYRNLMLLKDMMNTSSGKIMAQHRHDFMEMFLDDFDAEWEGRI